jgi:hypothetical protein
MNKLLGMGWAGWELIWTRGVINASIITQLSDEKESTMQRSREAIWQEQRRL